MAKRKIQNLQVTKVRYKVTHPLIGSDVEFSSWKALCEKAVELAEVEASEQLQPKFKQLALSIADEIVELAVEIED